MGTSKSRTLLLADKAKSAKITGKTKKDASQSRILFCSVFLFHFQISSAVSADIPGKRQGFTF
jgi:hypothetical protein